MVPYCGSSIRTWLGFCLTGSAFLIQQIGGKHLNMWNFPHIQNVHTHIYKNPTRLKPVSFCEAVGQCVVKHKVSCAVRCVSCLTWRNCLCWTGSLQNEINMELFLLCTYKMSPLIELSVPSGTSG